MPAPFPTPSAESTAHASTPVRLAVAGLGREGLEHAMAVATNPSCALAGLVEPRGALRAFARGCGFEAPATATLARLLRAGAPDGLIVCAPPGERAALAEGAAAAGIAVLVTGVSAGPADEAARLQSLASGASRPIAAGEPVLFHPLFARARAIVAEGTIGAPVALHGSAHVSRVFAAEARPRGADALSFVCADLALLVDLLFGPARTLRASGQRLFGDWLDEVRIEARLAGGLPATLDGSWSVPGYPRAALVLEASAASGRLLASDDALEVVDGPHGPVDARVRRFVAADAAAGGPFEAGCASAVVDAFARLVAGGPADLALDLARAARVAHTLEAARRSAAADGDEVEVPA